MLLPSYIWSASQVWKDIPQVAMVKGWMTSFRLGSQPRPSLSSFHLLFLPQLLSYSQLNPSSFPPLLSSSLSTSLLSSPALSPKTSAPLLLPLNQWECASLSHFKGLSWSLLSSARERERERRWGERNKVGEANYKREWEKETKKETRGGREEKWL